MYNNPYLAQLNNVNKQLANLASNNHHKAVNIVNQKKVDNSIMIMTSFNSNQNNVKPPLLNTTTS
jgi:hypothetical protein